MAPPEHPELRRAEAHVWRIRLDRPAALVRRLRGELSSDMAVEVKKKSHSRKKTCAWESKICVSRVRSVTSRYALRPAGRTSSHCDYSRAAPPAGELQLHCNRQAVKKWRSKRDPDPGMG